MTRRRRLDFVGRLVRASARADGNRQRQMNYDYAQSKLCQPSAMPGFFHHNSDRGCSGDRAVQCNVRDFDFYGAPYTLLSIAAVIVGARLGERVRTMEARMIEALGVFVRVTPVPMGFKLGH